MNKNRYFWIRKFFVLLVSILVSIVQINAVSSNILILHQDTQVLGGGEFFIVNMLQTLQDAGHNLFLLVPQEGPMSKKLKEYKFVHDLIKDKDQDKDDIYKKIYTMCKSNKIDIVMTPRTYLPEVKQVAEDLPIKIVIICQVESVLKKFKSYDNLKNIHGFLTVGHQPFFEVIEANKQYNLNIKNIAWVPPFFDENKFRQYSTHEIRRQYFKRKFGISIMYPTVITMIGNFYYNKKHKNHQLLFRAIERLVYANRKKVHVMLAGVGPRMAEYKQRVKDLKISRYVHFLGFVTDTPGLLFHSNFHVLTSRNEAFGIVHLEAAMMKKAALGAFDTGAEAVILDKKTGLLFKNNSVNDLVKCLLRLMDNPVQAEKMGQAGYKYVSKNFTNAISGKKLCDFIDKISTIRVELGKSA